MDYIGMTLNVAASPESDHSKFSSSASSSDNSIMGKSGQKQCPACGEKAFHKHFGSELPTCKGCSAFFRRTIVMKKNYKCRRNEKCVLTSKERHKHGCQACRFRKLVAFGMVINSVPLPSTGGLVATLSDPINQTSLKDLIRFRNSTFTSRFQALLKVHNGDRSIIGRSGFLKTNVSFSKAVHAESAVVEDYIRNTRAIQYDDYDSNFFENLRDAFLPMWMVIEVLSRNMKHMAFNGNKVYFVDDSYQVLNEDIMLRYYQSYNALRYPDVISRDSLALLTKVLGTAEKLHKNRIGEPELAICAYMLLIKEAKRLQGERSREYDQLINNLFQSLKPYYDKHADSVAIRFDDLMFTLEKIWEIKTGFDDLSWLVKLNAKDDCDTDTVYKPSRRLYGTDHYAIVQLFPFSER